MTHDSALDPGDPSTELRRQRDEFLAELDALRREAERVHAELVLPLWNDPVYHGLPQTLYGYMMATFSFIDALSRLGCEGANQTTRMRRLLRDYMGAPAEVAAVAVQLWRHTLMHTAKPRPLVNSDATRTYRWLLQWGDHLPREQHMTLQVGGSEAILAVGLLHLVEDLTQAARSMFNNAANSTDLRDRILSGSRALPTQVLPS